MAESPDLPEENLNLTVSVVVRKETELLHLGSESYFPVNFTGHQLGVREDFFDTLYLSLFKVHMDKLWSIGVIVLETFEC